MLGNSDLELPADRRLPVCITFAPVFMTAAIYITLYKR